MTPVPGKWYRVAYGKKGSKRAYHGKAKCLKKADSKLYGENRWLFRTPDQPEWQCEFAYLLFEPRDVKEETTSEPTYQELVAELERANKWIARSMVL